MQVVSTIWGIFALLGMLIGFFPCLGALNWINIPFSIAGLIVSAIAFASAKTPSKNGAIAGIICCSIAAFFGLVRLVVGFGIF